MDGDWARAALGEIEIPGPLGRPGMVSLGSVSVAVCVNLRSCSGLSYRTANSLQEIGNSIRTGSDPIILMLPVKALDIAGT